MLFLIKPYLEEIGEGNIKRNYKILIGKTPVKKIVSTCCFDLLKKGIHLKFQ
jgi:hypothetical protein